MLRHMIKLLVKLREMELSRQMERDQADFDQKHFNKKNGTISHSYGGDQQRPYVQVLTNDQFIYFQTIDGRQMLNDAPPSLGYARSYTGQDTCELLYKIFRGDTKLVRSMLEANYFAHTESHEWNILWSSGACKSYLYEGLNEYQKINHFPSSQEITRKDKLSINIAKMQHKHGKQAFDFLPDTYVIPDEFGDFYNHFQRLQQQDSKRNLWIVKPANLSRGRGIYIIDDIAEVNVEELSIISRYISNPLLINGHKFDLRIYVTVTSVDPLRIYVYKEGLARFATQEYSSNQAKGNKFCHLTNYSINKKSQNYVQNESLENDDFGFKWSLSAFCKHLEQIDIDMNLFWSRIFDVIIKSFLSAEHSIFTANKKTCIHRTNCYEVYGFDIMIDSDFKPWLIEINLSPSLTCDSQLDMKIKSQLLADTFNLIGVRQFDRKAESANKAKNRMKSYQNRGKSMGQQQRYNNGGTFNTMRDLQNLNNQLGGAFNSFMARSIGGNRSESQGGVQLNFTQPPNPNTIKAIESLNNDGEYAQDIEMLKKLSQVKHKDILRETLLELLRKGNYVCIYPARGSEVYDQYFQQVRPMNRFINKVLFQDETLKQIKVPITEDDSPESKALQSGIASKTGVNFRNIKDQLQDIQNVAKNCEKSMAQFSVKNSTKSSLSMIQMQQQNKSAVSSKNLMHNPNQMLTVDSKASFFKNSNGGKHQQMSPTTKCATLVGGREITGNSSMKKLVSDSQESTQMTNTYLMEDSKAGMVSLSSPQKTGKVVISGDDILIEYCERLKYALKQVPDAKLRPAQQAKLINFITHYVWQMADKVNLDKNGGRSGTPANKAVSYWSRIQNRIVEMKERRKQLLRIQYKSANNGTKKKADFQTEFAAQIKRKQDVLITFDSNKLETTLKESTKSTALELVMTLVPKDSKLHGILIELEVCFGLKIDPESPSYNMRGGSGQYDANGNTIALTEKSLTLTDDSDQDIKEHKSPAPIAYSDKRHRKQQQSDKKPPMSSHALGRTSSAFVSSGNLQGNSLVGKKQPTPGGASNNKGVVMLQDMMIDRSPVDLPGKGSKMSSNQNRSALDVQEDESIQKKSSKAQVYEQNILNAIRTNNFFMNTNAPNINKEVSAGFTLTKTGFNSSLSKKQMHTLSGSSDNQKPYSFRNSQQSQQSLGVTAKKLSEPSMVHNSKFPPSGRHTQKQAASLIKSNRLPPNRSSLPIGQQQQRRQVLQSSAKMTSSSSYYPTGSSGATNLQASSTQYRNSNFSKQFNNNDVNLVNGLNTAISGYHKAGSASLTRSDFRIQQYSDRNNMNQREQQKRNVTRSNTMFTQRHKSDLNNSNANTHNRNKKLSTAAPGQQQTDYHAVGGSTQASILGVRSTIQQQKMALLNKHQPSQKRVDFNSNEGISNDITAASNKMQSRIKSAVIMQRPNNY